MVIQHRHSELSPEDAKAAGCQGKAAFVSWNVAKKKADRMTKRDKSAGVCQPYRCRMCGFIHIGSVSPDQQRVNRIKRAIRRRIRRGEPQA